MKVYQLLQSQLDGSLVDFEVVFTLEAYDSNNDGQTVRITASDLFQASVGTRWEVTSGPCHNANTIKDILEMIYKTSDGYLLNGERYFCEGAPNYETVEVSRLIWVNLFE